MADALTKVYIEVTTACNLDCVMCVRRVWRAPAGAMPRRTFAALMDLDLDRLVVSVDGVTATRYEQIRERGSFQRVIDNLRELKRIRLHRHGRHGNPQLALAFVAMQENIGVLPLLPALAIQVGAWEVLVSNVVPHSAEMEKQILYRAALNAVAYRASRWAPALSLPKMDVEERTLEPLRGVFTSTVGSRLRDFGFSPCRTCGGCERFPFNDEDCSGNGFPTYGACLWAQGFVQGA